MRIIEHRLTQFSISDELELTGDAMDQFRSAADDALQKPIALVFRPDGTAYARTATAKQIKNTPAKHRHTLILAGLEIPVLAASENNAPIPNALSSEHTLDVHKYATRGTYVYPSEDDPEKLAFDRD